ncbi:hypothetical protein TYRP_007990 [Tyrophagus putrescentiae]|nr:hypothetical protein TYRP_007990 [Tyrophagus putrescentiae]
MAFRKVLLSVLLTLIVFNLVLLRRSDAISMTPKEYRQLVEARCFNQTTQREPFVLGQSRPVGLSLDYLVSLTRTIEERLPQLSAKEMQIEKMQLTAFPEDSLTEDEKCAMFFMVSHTLAVSSINSVSNVKNLPLFGAEGAWNSTYCQTQYKLSTEGHLVTLADFNGAITGWLLGRKLMSEGGQFLKKLKLSTILERFFSKDGLTSDCGICSMEYMAPEVVNTIRENARSYLAQWNTLYNKDNFDLERLSGEVELNAIQFSQYIQKAKGILQEECTRLSNIQFGNTQCETQSDTFIMIDNNLPYQFYSKFQLEFVTSLLSKLDNINYLGTATLFVNALRGFESDQLSLDPLDLRIPLHLLAYNTTSVQLATCRLAWYPYRETTINNKKTLLDNLVQLFERNNVTNLNRANSKNFVWLSLKNNAYKPLNDREKAMYHKYRFYLKYFLHIRTFLVASYDKDDDDDLNDIVVSNEDWIKVIPSNLYDPTMVDRVVQKMCETPVPLVYDSCLSKTSSEVVQENFISPMRKQYWAIYPKYFLQSKSVVLKFKANGAKIRVCLDRYVQPENNAGRHCREASGDSGEVQFEVEKPCPWKTVDTCLPIYFTVFLANRNFVAPNDCLEPRCKSMDQVRWTVTHSGLFCPMALFSSSGRPVASFYQITLLLLAVALFYKTILK